MILLNHTVDVTGIFMANNIHIERQRYTLFIYGKRPGTKKSDKYEVYIKRIYNFVNVNVINSNKIEII